MPGPDRDAGEPSLERQLVRLAVPAFVALVAEPLFLLVDSAIVGRLGTVPLAALGIAGAALTVVVSLCVFLAYATTAAVARQAGAGDLRGAVAQGMDGLWLAGAIGAVCAVAGQAVAPWAVAALGASEAVAPGATTYLRIGLTGLPGMLLVLAATGVLRGVQDTRTPLLVASAGGVLNAVLNYLLVYPAGLGLPGSALGTVLTQTAMGAALALPVVRAARRHDVPLRPHPAGLGRSAAAGVPLLVRTLTLRAALLLGTYVAARTPRGDVALAAHQVAGSVWSFLAFALDALAIAAQALVGHALGSGDPARARRVLRRTLEWGLVSGVVLGAAALALRGAYVPVFSSDPAVQDALSSALVVVALLQPVAALVFVLDGVLIGAGDGRYLAVAGVVTLVVYAPLALAVLAADGGLVPLWWAFGAFMGARLVTLVLRARGERWMVLGAGR
ncbi:MATE family efflux transporter [Motilibacter sp. K478]|nr:MATE family efflux transporter [Motilibacter aurantiacus]